MTGEYKILLDAAVAPEAQKPTAQSEKRRSQLTTALQLLALCLAVAAATVLIFNRQAKGPGRDEGSYDLRHALRQISNIRAAIHLQGRYNSSMKTSVEWQNQVDQAHSQGGLELDNNEIVIPRKGLYFIYSQVSFRVDCSSGGADDSKTMVHLSHTVKRWSNTYENDDGQRSYETILHSVRTACQKAASRSPGEEGSWFSTVYMGAVFNLSKGDRLKTMMEEKMLLVLEDDPGKTFFGVFAL